MGEMVRHKILFPGRDCILANTQRRYLMVTVFLSVYNEELIQKSIIVCFKSMLGFKCLTQDGFSCLLKHLLGEYGINETVAAGVLSNIPLKN